MARYVVVVKSTDPGHLNTLGQAVADEWQLVPIADDRITWLAHKDFLTEEAGHGGVEALGVPGDIRTVTTNVRGMGQLTYLIGTDISKDIFEKLVSPAVLDPAAPGGGQTEGSDGGGNGGPPDGGGGSGPKKDGATKPDPPATPTVVDPLAGLQEKLWQALPPEVQRAKAEEYFGQALSAYRTEADSARWAAAPELAALLRVKDGDQADLAKQLFYVKAGISRYQKALDANDLALAFKRAELATTGVNMANEFLTQVKRWTTLSRYAVGALVIGIVLFTAGSAAAFLLTAKGKVDGPSLALIVFVLAVAAISPAVLLLLQRPLKGIDSFSPTGSSSASGSADGSSSAAASTAGSSSAKSAS